MMEPYKGPHKRGEQPSPNGVKELMWWMAEVGRLVDDPEALAQAVEIQAELDRQIRAAARRLNGEGYSWNVIGRVFRISAVAAAKRFRRTGGESTRRSSV